MNKKILLVDDAAFMRMMWRDMLTREGYTIVGEATDGGEAVEMYKQISPDLVLLDIVMPTLDGICALQQIRQYDANANVVMCSAMGQAYIVTDTLMAGARGFIAKPFQPDTLLTTVRESFLGERIYNREILEYVHDQCADDKQQLLTQAEVIELIRLASGSATGATGATGAAGPNGDEVEVFIRKIRRGSIPVRNPQDESGENNINILTVLNKLVQGQEEIKELLKSMR